MVSLPTYVFINDLSLQRQQVPNVIKSASAVGPQKTRPVQSVPMFQVSMQISVCLDKFDAFRSWYQADLGFGAYWFLMNDPFNGEKRRFRFTEYDTNWQKSANTMTTSVVVESYDEL